MGHSYLTHSFILKKEEPPVFVACKGIPTVKHLLIECADLMELGRNILRRNLLLTFLECKPRKKLDFVRGICVFCKM